MFNLAAPACIFYLAQPVADMACNFPQDDSLNDLKSPLEKTIFYNEENLTTC